jgi:hypothetical protein
VAKTSALTAEEWIKLRDEIDPSVRREVDSLLIEHDVSTFDGFSVVCGRIATMVGSFKIPPQVAEAMKQFLELQLNGLMIAKDKFPMQQQAQGSVDLTLILQQAQERTRQISEKMRPQLTVIDRDDDDG